MAGSLFRTKSIDLLMADAQETGEHALKRTLDKAFSADAPVLIEVPVERGTEASPWAFLTPNFG